MKSLGNWVLDQVFEVIGYFAEHSRDRRRTADEREAYRIAVREATNAHMARCRCTRVDCPRRRELGTVPPEFARIDICAPAILDTDE